MILFSCILFYILYIYFYLLQTANDDSKMNMTVNMRTMFGCKLKTNIMLLIYIPCEGDLQSLSVLKIQVVRF